MTMLPPIADFLAVQQLLNSLWARTDRVIAEPAEQLFLDDARMRIGTLLVEGREAIDRYHAERRASEDKSGRRVRHFCTNLIVDHHAASEIRLRCSVLVFQGLGELPFESALPSNIGDFLVTFRKAADGNWLLAELDGTVIFRGAGAAVNAR